MIDIPMTTIKHKEFLTAKKNIQIDIRSPVIRLAVLSFNLHR